MADLIEQSWKWAQQAEKELQATLTEKDPTFRKVDHQIAQYRAQCQNLIFQDFGFALGKDVENRLWNAHIKINNRFRKQLSTFREGPGKRKLVERRKAVKHYLDFIKSSQRFYRGYIQGLDLHFGGIHELKAVSNKLNLIPSSTNIQATASDNLRHAVLMSCHQTLIRLGDLSRYRESEQAGKEYNWGPAIGYYTLAGVIYPASGASHNQLAVIARADANHLRATYHLYRALAVEKPHPAARGNLELEFKKIHEAWEKGEVIANDLQSDGQGSEKALVGWFMRLHARCYNGVDFVEHDELENEVLSQLAVDLKERSLEGTLNKIIVINIAAEQFAIDRLLDAPESVEYKHAFFFFLRLNVRTLSTLLQVLQPELELFAEEENVSGADSLLPNSTGRTTAVARRVLPVLRHYSSWLAIRAEILIAEVGDSPLNVQIKELWKTYANTLTLLASTFSSADLPVIDYVLEEDEDILGFKPLKHECREWRYRDEVSGIRKPKYHDQGVEVHHTNIEMLGRIRDLIMDGLKLQLVENIPIKLGDGATFAYHEEGLTDCIGSPEVQQAKMSSISIKRDEIQQANSINQPDTASAFGEGASEVASISVSTTTHRWVDNLVGSETADTDIHQGLHSDFARFIPPTPPSYSFKDSPAKQVGNDTSYGLIGTLTAQELIKDAGNDTSYSLIGTQTARDLAEDLQSDSLQNQHHTQQHSTYQSLPQPPLPSILNSPFAPQPGESTPDARPTTAIRMTTHSPRTSLDSFSIQQQQQQQQQPPPTTYSITSTASSIPDPSNAAFERPQNQALLPKIGYYGVIERPSAKRGVGNTASKIDDGGFHSSSIFHDSSWEIQKRSGSTVPTPPNGQGEG